MVYFDINYGNNLVTDGLVGMKIYMILGKDIVIPFEMNHELIEDLVQNFHLP